MTASDPIATTLRPRFLPSGRAAPGEGLRFLRAALEVATPDHCILWPYASSTRVQNPDSRYGYVYYQKRTVQVHRLALCLVTGVPLDDPRLVLHGPCHNQMCFNPCHLRFGTALENQQDRLRDGTNISVLTPEQVLAIRQDDRVLREIAADYGVSLSCVYAARTRKTWRYL